MASMQGETQDLLSLLECHPDLKPPLPDKFIDFYAEVGPTKAALERHCEEAAEKSRRNSVSVREAKLELAVQYVYPPIEGEDTAADIFPPHISMFCFPHGYPPPTFVESEVTTSSFYFVLTALTGNFIYANCRTIRERIELKDGTEMFAIRCICLLSHYPMHATLLQCLELLEPVIVSSSSEAKLRTIAHIVDNVPLPPQGGTTVLFSIRGSDRISLKRPSVGSFPLKDFSFRPLFELLSPENIILLMSCLMLEKKMVLLSDDESLPAKIGSAILYLLYPFRWQNIYIPRLPDSLMDIVNAPTPYLLGVSKTGDLDLSDCPETVVVDIEKDDVSLMELLPPLPEPGHQRLMSKISEERRVVTAFLSFMVSVFQSYRDCVHIVSQRQRRDTDNSTFRRENAAFAVYNKVAFLKSQPAGSQAFLSEFVETQMFTAFLGDVLEPSASLFEDCLQTDAHTLEGFLDEIDAFGEIEGNVFIVPPEEKLGHVAINPPVLNVRDEPDMERPVVKIANDQDEASRLLSASNAVSHRLADLDLGTVDSSTSSTSPRQKLTLHPANGTETRTRGRTLSAVGVTPQPTSELTVDWDQDRVRSRTSPPIHELVAGIAPDATFTSTRARSATGPDAPSLQELENSVQSVCGRLAQASRSSGPASALTDVEIDQTSRLVLSLLSALKASTGARSNLELKLSRVELELDASRKQAEHVQQSGEPVPLPTRDLRDSSCQTDPLSKAGLLSFSPDQSPSPSHDPFESIDNLVIDLHTQRKVESRFDDIGKNLEFLNRTFSKAGL